MNNITLQRPSHTDKEGCVHKCREATGIPSWLTWRWDGPSYRDDYSWSNYWCRWELRIVYTKMQIFLDHWSYILFCPFLHKFISPPLSSQSQMIFNVYLFHFEIYLFCVEHYISSKHVDHKLITEVIYSMNCVIFNIPRSHSSISLVNMYCYCDTCNNCSCVSLAIVSINVLLLWYICIVCIC